MARFHETLRRLAMIDEGLVEDEAGRGLDPAAALALDLKTAALLRVAASVAIGSDPGLDYCEVSPELRRVRGPYPIANGIAAYVSPFLSSVPGISGDDSGWPPVADQGRFFRATP